MKSVKPNKKRAIKGHAQYLNKKAGSRVPYTIAWLILVVLAVGGIALSASAFSSYKVDTRSYEANILSKQILLCIAENGELEPIFQPSFNLEKECKLNLKVDGFYEYLINLTLYNYENCNNMPCTTIAQQDGNNLSKEIGDKSLAVYCGITEAKGKVPKCYEENFYVLYNQKPHFLGIKIAVNKQEQNIR